MAGLRALLDLGGGGAGLPNAPQRVLNVYDTQTMDANNGGACCLWTVPADTYWVGVEMWGGGGGGAGKQCGAGYASGAGAYGRKIFDVVPGEQFTICAAGSTCCRNTTAAGGLGFAGNPSYMCRDSVCCMIAEGGDPGGVCCCWTCGFAQPCRAHLPESNATGFTFAVQGLQGNAKWGCESRCYVHNAVPPAPFTYGGLFFTRNGCCHQNGRGFVCGGPMLFPGGGTPSAVSLCFSRCCCGGAGAGGLVTLIYYSATAP